MRALPASEPRKASLPTPNRAGVLAGYLPCPHPSCPDAVALRKPRACPRSVRKLDRLVAGSIVSLLTKAVQIQGWSPEINMVFPLDAMFQTEDKLKQRPPVS